MTSRPWTEPSHVDAMYEASLVGREDYVTTLIGVAERKLAREVDDLESRLGAGSLDVEDVRDVVAQAVIRYIRNPGGLTQSSITEGPFTRSNSYAAAAAAQAGTGISFTEDELDGLRTDDDTGLPEGIGVVHQSLPRWRVP